ncbi:hypothetical protein D7Z26_10225 [Cohnella endophytica]|uniref:Uncharacterized protein n=1 Tax=Cohnella endophytica TaxID=2419778 RepID=A0A494Y6J6_9BACL|nr:hypothetical protein D7Z26_10225 [Cohnella endophytica]
MIFIDIKVKSLNFNRRIVKIAIIQQGSIGIENNVYPDTQINLYGDSKALYYLGAFFNLIQREKSMIIYLQRSSNNESDIVFFHGTSNPISFSDCIEIRNKATKLKHTELYSLEIKEETRSDKLKEIMEI